MTALLELTEPAAEQAGRVAVKLCPSQREEEDGLTAWARVVRGTSEGVRLGGLFEPRCPVRLESGCGRLG